MQPEQVHAELSALERMLAEEAVVDACARCGRLLERLLQALLDDELRRGEPARRQAILDATQGQGDLDRLTSGTLLDLLRDHPVFRRDPALHRALAAHVPVRNRAVHFKRGVADPTLEEARAFSADLRRLAEARWRVESQLPHLGGAEVDPGVPEPTDPGLARAAGPGRFLALPVVAGREVGVQEVAAFLHPADLVGRRYEVVRGLSARAAIARHHPSHKTLVLRFHRYRYDAQGPAEVQASFDRFKAVKSPHLVRLGELSAHAEQVFHTEEHFAQETLRNLMDQRHRAGQSLSLGEASAICTQVLQGLVALHDAGLVHRALAPERILVQTVRTGPGGASWEHEIKLAEPRFAVVRGERPESYHEVSYRAPELGEELPAVPSPAEDIYAVGIILFELLVGQVPRGTYLPPSALRSDVGREIDDVVERSLVPWPEDRYDTARDFLADLSRVKGAASVPGGASGRRRALVIALGVMAVVALVGGLLLAARGLAPG